MILQNNIFKSRKKEIILYLLGLIILAFGISLIIESDLGASPWDLLAIDLNQKITIGIGSWSVINQCIVVLLTAIIFHKRINIASIIPAFIQGFLMNLMIPYTNKIVINNKILLIFGCALTALGLVIYTNQSFSSNAIDNFTVTMQSEKHISFGKSKIITDMIPIILILILGSIPKAPTIIIYIIIPFFIFLYEKFGKYFTIFIKKTRHYRR